MPAQARLGGFYSVNLLLRSIDFHAIKSRYHASWGEFLALLAQEIEHWCAWDLRAW